MDSTPPERCMFCPTPREDEIRSMSPIEGCDGPVFTLRGLVEITGIGGEQTLRVADPNVESLSQNCGREDLGLTEDNSFQTVINGMKYVFRVNKRTAQSIQQMNDEERNKLGQEIMQDFDKRAEGQMDTEAGLPKRHSTDGDSRGTKLTLVGSTRRLASARQAPEQIYAELGRLSQGDLITGTTQQCERYITLIEEALEGVLAENSKSTQAITTQLQRAHKLNGESQIFDDECRDKIKSYLIHYEAEDAKATPTGYQELQKAIDTIKVSRALHDTTISGVRNHLESIMKVIETGPFSYLATITKERNLFTQGLLIDVRDKTFVNDILENAHRCAASARYSYKAMDLVKGGLRTIAQRL